MGERFIEISDSDLRRLLKRFRRRVFFMGFCAGVITGMGLWQTYLLAIGWTAP